MRRNSIIITIDYETWQPSSAEYPINWEKDILENTENLMRCAESAGAKLSLMAEMGEYFWLKDNLPQIAEKIRLQLQDAVKRGHDVQLHIHPNWFPETGVSYMDGEYHWDWNIASCNDYPFDLTELIKKCKKELESIIKPVKSDYKVLAFRAGGYRVQPFDRLYEALSSNGIFCDTSVYRGGKSIERGYNFSKCKSNSKPYYSDRYDPQIEDKNSSFVEFPVATWKKNVRFFIDNNEANMFGKRFLNLNKSYFSKQNNPFVFIGHSKGVHDYEAIKNNLILLKNIPGTVFCTFSEYYKNLNVNSNSENSIKEVKEIMDCIYKNIQPSDEFPFSFPSDVFMHGTALCEGYANSCANILNMYGYKVKRITLFAKNMPNGRGKKNIDTHELISLKLNGNSYLLDPCVNMIIPKNIKDVLHNPDYSNVERITDNRYNSRNYQNYSTSFFYNKVFKYIYKHIRREFIIGTGKKVWLLTKLHNFFLCFIVSKVNFYNKWCDYK